MDLSLFKIGPNPLMFFFIDPSKRDPLVTFLFNQSQIECPLPHPGKLSSFDLRVLPINHWLVNVYDRAFQGVEKAFARFDRATEGLVLLYGLKVAGDYYFLDFKEGVEELAEDVVQFAGVAGFQLLFF